MQEAIRETQELIKDRQEREIESSDPNDIKRDINNLLWQYMDGNVSIEDADTISMVVLDMIKMPNKYLRPDKNTGTDPIPLTS